MARQDHPGYQASLHMDLLPLQLAVCPELEKKGRMVATQVSWVDEREASVRPGTDQMQVASRFGKRRDLDWVEVVGQLFRQVLIQLRKETLPRLATSETDHHPREAWD